MIFLINKNNVIVCKTSFLMCSMARKLAIHVYIFQVDCHSVNVLCVSKYAPNVIFCNANINTQHTIKHNQLYELARILVCKI